MKIVRWSREYITKMLASIRTENYPFTFYGLRLIPGLYIGIFFSRGPKLYIGIFFSRGPKRKSEEDGDDGGG